ncbi:DUF2200 family protein [Asticcacaulis sp. AC402]|uniref:DUF2200 family protein n=1 Tax=Asticcacaulis sp. AC402 TaxID=1282361 RepID=UPI0003C3BC43|nr:DUF2200 family protein [Asticcacaulis sp. AC402]ESQ77453.1 hypothetical protein ABAC402_01235 [Asticcacaulis sp. AC402]
MAEVDQIVHGLTGYSQARLKAHLTAKTDIESFLAQAPHIHPSRQLITAKICDAPIEGTEGLLMREIHYADKLIDDLARGKPMEKILRQQVRKIPLRNESTRKIGTGREKPNHNAWLRLSFTNG